VSLNSHIEWTDATWNPVRGCTKISPGKRCYAETFAERFRGVKGHPYEQGFDLRLVPEKLTEPFTWRSPKTSGGESVWRIASTDCQGSRICSKRARKCAFCPLSRFLEDLGRIDLSGINWVIVGGESGPGARPMDKEWVLSIREQCRSHGIPFVFKQWGRRTKKEEWKSAGGADLR
jgi:protein gp37